MKTLRHIEVEPLSAQRWAKLERALFARVELGTGGNWHSQRMGRRLGSSAWFAAAAVVGALAITGLALYGRPERTTLDHPSRITTGATGSHLAFPGLALDVEPQSVVVVGAETPEGRLVVLDSGKILCQVAPRSTDAPLIVQAGGTRVRVLGTRFSVTRSNDAARVEVQQGVVEVTSAGESQRVRAGEEWPKRVAQRSTLTEPAPGSDATALPSVTRPALPQVAERKGASALRVAPNAVVARRADEPSARPDDGATAATVAPEDGAIKAGSSHQAVFEQATLLEQRDPARASQLYRSLEAGADSWAQNALYARGRLEASRGNRAEARQLLGRYLERFPRGSNAEDAKAVLQRLRSTQAR